MAAPNLTTMSTSINSYFSKTNRCGPAGGARETVKQRETENS